MAHLEEAKRIMIERHLKGRGLTDKRVLDAMAKVRREAFLPAGLKPFAYDDRPLPIGEGQTISQPFIVGHMADALELKGGEKVLEIGTGSGYGAAVLGEIAGEVFTIERHKPLADAAKKALEKEGCKNVHVVVGDGSRGLPDEAPFGGIVATAAAARVPEALKKQLAVGAHLVVPVGPPGYFQRLLRITHSAKDAFREEDLGGVAFVPLVGADGP